MKKTVGILSVLLALTIAVNAVTPAMSVTIQKLFSPEPQVASVYDSFSNDYVSEEDYSVANGSKSTASSAQKEAAYEDGKILIYNFEQLSMIGSGKSYKYDDGVTATYSSDAEYKLARDISLPRHTVWQLPDGFKGKITGEKQSYAPLYEAQRDAIYLYNPYQLAVMAMDNREEQPVMSGDAEASTFGSGQIICTDEENKDYLTYSGEHNYVVSSQFCSEITEKPVSVRTAKKSVEAVGAQADSSVGAADDYVNGRDFTGQVLKTIGNTTYILIGTADQLKKIGTDTEVYTRVYKVKNGAIVQENGKDVILYGGDADLALTENGYKNFSFQSIYNDGLDGDYAGVNQSDGSLGASYSTQGTSNDTRSWKTGVKYTIDANYIVFRNIDLGTDARNPWTPLMFSGNMYGIKGSGTSTLWSGNALSARTTANRPKISNVYVNQTANIDVEKYIGIGFFATISNEVDTADIGLSRGTVHVENIELNQVSVHNSATAIKQNFSLVSSLLSTLGGIVGYVADVLLWTLSFGETKLKLSDTLKALLNARKKDPTSFATGGFAGRVVGDVDIFNCAVTGTVTVENVKDYTGGFIGYSDGVTKYSGLSTLLGDTVNTLANLLNIVPALGLGDLVTILLGNHVLNLGQLIPTGYYEPKVRSCTVDGLTGQIGHFSGTPQTPDTDYNGGFIGCQIGTVITDSEVVNSTYIVVAKEYGGGFAGIARDGEVKGTLTDLGVDLLNPEVLANAISNSLNNVNNIRSFQTESLLRECRIFDCDVTVSGGANLGGFVGALAASYAIDCDIKQSENTNHTLSVAGTGDAVGGFVGTATLGWFSTLGASTASGNDSLISAVRQIGAGLLSTGDQSQSQKLLALAGLVPSATLGVQIDVGTVNVGGKNYVGGVVGRGQGVILAESSAENMNKLTFWEQNNISSKTARANYLKKLHAVTATGDYVGGVAGQLETINVAGLLDGTLSAGSYASFKVSGVTVEGVDAGYTVTSEGTASAQNNGNFVAGGFGKAFGGTIDNVKLVKLQKVEAANNVAAGFIGAAGPGDVAGSTGLTVNLLGLNKLITVTNLLSVGQHIHVTIRNSDVTGIDSGYTVEAKGSGNTNPAYRYIASGFIGQSNSTEIENCHAYKLLFVKAAAEKGYSGGFIGTSETGGLADMAGNNGGNITALLPTDTDENGAVVSVNGLVDAIGYLIPKYTNCTTNFVNGGYVDADIAGGFVADFESGTVDNTNIADVDDAENPQWTKTIKRVYDPGEVYPVEEGQSIPTAVEKQFAVFNINEVRAQTYGGGFGGKLRSGALAKAGKGISILGDLKIGTQSLSISLDDLANVMNTYVPYVKHAGVYSERGFTVTAEEIRAGDVLSGSAGGFAGLAQGAQISSSDVYQLKHTDVTPPSDLETANAETYYNSSSAYAVTGGHFAGGYVGNADIGDAASVGDGLGVLGSLLSLDNIASALSVVVTTIEHSDVQGAPGGFSAKATDSAGTVGKSGGFAGEVSGAHIQNSHCKNFYYIIGRETAGGYVGSLKPGDVARLLDKAEVIAGLAEVSGSLLSLVEDFVPTIRNSTTSCVPCGGAVRAQAESDSTHQRGCAGGYCGHNEGGHIWGLDTHTWQDQNDGEVLGRYFGHDREGEYTGEQHICTAWRIRSVYGYEYAGGFTGYMESADTADTGNIKLLGGLISANNVLSALSAVYPTEETTAVYGPLRNMDVDTWNAWVTYVGRYGGYGAELAKTGTVSTQAELNGKLSKYIYGCNIVAGRSTHDNMLITEGGNAGGYIGYMVTGVITNGQSYDMKQIRAMRSAGGYAGRMQTGSAAEFGSANILGLNLNVGQLVQAVQVFVPTIKSGSVRGWQSGMTVTGYGTDFTNRCGYAGGYVGSAYGAQIWGDENVGSTAGTGCNVYNLRYVKGNNAAGGYVGLATAASVADVSTNASKGFLQRLLNTLISTPGDLASVMQATITTIRKAEVSPDNSSFGFTVDGTGGSHPQFAGGFAGSLEASVIGSRKGESDITVNGLRSVDGQYYAGGFVGLADVGSVATVSSTGTGSTNILSLIQAGSVDLFDVFRTYIYYSDVNGVNDGIVVKAYSSAQEGILSETRFSGCAGGFGGGIMNGTVKNSNVTKLNTVVAPNYTGGFIGHAGKNGAVDVDDAAVSSLLGLTAGVLDIFGTVVDDCDVTGIDTGTVIYSVGGEQPIAGGHTGYADVAQIKNSNVTKLMQVCSEQIAGGFVGKTNMNYLVEAEVDSALVQVVLGIVNSLLKILQVHRLEEIDLINTDALLSNLGISNLLGLKLLSDGDLLYVNLFGLRIGVSLVQPDGEGSSTGTAVVTIGDSSVSLPYNENGINTSGENAEAVINLIKGNRTRVDNCSVTGIDVGYDVYGGGASNTEDGTHANGYAGGFVGYNNEGQFTSDTMIYCDVVRGTAKKVGPFSGGTRLESVYSFNTLASIEGENNKYSVYRSTDKTTALTADNQTISSNPTTDGNYKRFDVTYLADPIKPGENEPYEKIYQKWSGAKLASGASDTSPTPITLYRSSAKAVLMADTPTYANDESLIPNPGESKDPCGNIDLTIQKIWDDQSNKDGSRPAAIKVRILQQKHTVDGTAIGDPVNFLDSSIITDQNFDTTDGWFTISSDDGRADSATWTRVIKGLPVYVTDNGTDYYYSYTVEEDSVLGYTADYSYDESGATATITNTPKDFVIEFKYYDRYEENGRPAGIESEETVYSTTLKGIPDKYVIRDASGNVTGVNYAGIIGEEAVEFSDSLGVNNVMCDYDLWTSQRDAVSALSGNDYFYFDTEGENSINHVPYADDPIYHYSYGNNQQYHTDYLGKPLSSGERWVNYYDSENAPIYEESDGTVKNYTSVNKIVVWCYNYPKLYNVDIFGADDGGDLIPKTVDGNTVYVADNTKTNKATRNEKLFYYNQRFCEKTGDAYQDAAGFIENYGLVGYREDVQPKDLADEAFEDYTFAYWAYDQEGKQIASVERNFGYRVTTKTELYAVYTKGGSSTAGISISANTNDTYVDSSGVSRTRLNILANIYGAPVFDSSIKKLSFVNISLSTQIRDNPTVYTPQRVSALFDQYKDQLKGIIEKFEADNARQFTSAETFNGDINPEPDPETGKYWVNQNLNLTLTTKGYIYNVTSNGGEPKDNTEMKLTNKNRAHFTITYKTSALNVNGTGSNGDTCLIYCGAMKYGDEWKVSTNCLIYYNGSVVKNTDESWV